MRVYVYVLCGHLLGKADHLALVCGVFCEFVTFLIGILGQVWYLIVSIPDLCTLTYFGSEKIIFDKMTAVRT